MTADCILVGLCSQWGEQCRTTVHSYICGLLNIVGCLWIHDPNVPTLSDYVVQMLVAKPEPSFYSTVWPNVPALSDYIIVVQMSVAKLEPSSYSTV